MASVLNRHFSILKIKECQNEQAATPLDLRIGMWGSSSSAPPGRERPVGSGTVVSCLRHELSTPRQIRAGGQGSARRRATRGHPRLDTL